jgi:hypothetical protein
LDGLPVLPMINNDSHPGKTASRAVLDLDANAFQARSK